MSRSSRFFGRTTGLVAIMLLLMLALAASTTADTASYQITDVSAPNAPPPPTLNYQGRLADPVTGAAVADGLYRLYFSLYDVEIGGSPLWQEDHTVEVRNGLFSTRLGDAVALPAVFDGRPLWLAIAVERDPEATPRLPLSFAAYAIYSHQAGVAEYSANAAELGGLPPSSYAAAAHNHDAAAVVSGVLAYDRFSAYGDLANDARIGPAAGMVAAGIHDHRGTDIVDGSIGTVDLADGSVTSAKIADGNVASADLAANSVDTTKMADLSVGTNDLANSSVTSAKIADLGVATADLANSSVTAAKIADGSVTSAKLASGVVPRFLTLEPYAAYLEGGATFSSGFGPYAGINLPDTASSSFSLGFTIPPDYTPGTALTVRFVWHTSSTSCGIELPPNFISVARPGRTHLVGMSATTGFSAVGGTLLSAPATANMSGEKNFTITSPVAAETLQPGDSIIFGVYRSNSSASDTCTGALKIQAIRITY